MSDPQADSAETRQLLDRAKGGDDSAVRTLFSRHRPFLRQVVEARINPQLRPRIDPSDVVQETHVEACRQLERFVDRPPLPFRLWLRKLACQRLTMLERRHIGAARRSLTREVRLSVSSSLKFARQVLEWRGGPASQAIRREALHHVREALAELGEADREILLLRNLEQLSNEEAARVLQIEPVAASQRYGRALLRLRRRLVQHGLLEDLDGA